MTLTATAAKTFPINEPDAAAITAHAAPGISLLLTCDAGRVLIYSGERFPCRVLTAGDSAILPQRQKNDTFYFPTNRFAGRLYAMPTASLPEDLPAEGTCFAVSQYRFARAAYRTLNDNLSRHIPIGQLAEKLEISPTHLKNSFRLVYGDSLYAFIRTQKMLAAAELLVQNGNRRTVLDIAGDFGYDNGSKFARAFQIVMGMSPREFRSAPCLPPESVRSERRAVD